MWKTWKKWGIVCKLKVSICSYCILIFVKPNSVIEPDRVCLSNLFWVVSLHCCHSWWWCSNPWGDLFARFSVALDSLAYFYFFIIFCYVLHVTLWIVFYFLGVEFKQIHWNKFLYITWLLIIAGSFSASLVIDSRGS